MEKITRTRENGSTYESQDERRGENKAGLWGRLDQTVRGSKLNAFRFRQSDSIFTRVEALLRGAARSSLAARRLLLERLRREVKLELEGWKEGVTHMFS